MAALRCVLGANPALGRFMLVMAWQIPAPAVMGALGNARGETLAELSGQTAQEVIAAIEETGLVDVAATDTVSRLAGGDRARQGAIISAAFGRLRAAK